MRAISQFVAVPLNPIPILDHFRRSHPQCEHNIHQHISFCYCETLIRAFVTSKIDHYKILLSGLK